MNPPNPMRLLYEQAQLPVFQNRMYDTREEAVSCPMGDLQLVEDLTTGLVYNAAFNADLMIYDEHYQNEQGLSALFQRHLESVAQIVERAMGSEAIVEVGCGKGFFLELLLSKGVEVTGFDPTYEGANPQVVKKYFESGSGIQAKGLILRHVLEHIENPFEFLTRLAAANGGGGLIYIEVPCFAWICEHKAWFDLFYEHVNYFRISDFECMFGSVVESGHLFGGQYLYVVAELATLRAPQRDSRNAVSFPSDFVATIVEHEDPLADDAAIWGGASKGVIFSLLKGRAGQRVGTVIDINPAKQGKYLPSTGLRVQSPAEALPSLRKGSTIYVMNSNYLEEIKKMSSNAFNYMAVDHE